MKVIPIILLAAGLLAAVGCSKSSSNDLYKGSAVTVILTDNVPATGQTVIQDIYNPAVKQIIAIVQIPNAKTNMDVKGEWYQMGVIQQKAQGLTAQGALISSAGFKVTSDAINSDSHVGGGRLSLTPNAALPEDSYLLKVFIDGKLAKVAPFVVSALVPGPGSPAAPAATPVRTATPPAPTPVATGTPAR